MCQFRSTSCRETSIGVNVERQFAQLRAIFITNNRLIIFLSPNRNYYVAGVGKVSVKFRVRPLPEIFRDFSRIVSPQTDLAGAVTGRFVYRPVSSIA